MTSCGCEAGERHQVRMKRTVVSLQFRSDDKLLHVGIPLDSEQIGLAADLAIFYVALFGSVAEIDERFVPLATASALETGFHDLFIFGQGSTRRYRSA
jgi:hypothetical protein